MNRILVVAAFLLSCQPRPELTVDVMPPPEEDAGCTYWVCRGCERDATLDWACWGHEFLTQYYADCPGEFDLCKPNDYGGWCCFPAPGQP